MNYIKDSEIKGLSKKLDAKNFKPEDIQVGYQYRGSLGIVRNEERVFNRVKEDKYIESMLNSYNFIYNARLAVTDSDIESFKNAIFEFVTSLNMVPEYAACVLAVVAETFADRKGKRRVMTEIVEFDITELISSIPVLAKRGYPMEELAKLQESLKSTIGRKIVDLNGKER